MRATLFTALGLLLVAPAAIGSPRVPADDGEVLERLAVKRGDPVLREQAALAKALAADPGNLGIAVRLARLHVERSRRESDPRQLGQAQAALRPWWEADHPPVAALLVRATIRQTLHQFTPALSDLRQATTEDPGNAQAWLTRASVEQVSGDLDAARRSCERLRFLSIASVAMTCLAAVQGATGHAAVAYDSLAAALADPRTPQGLRAWMFGVKAEMAERLGRAADAEAAYRAALAIDPDDAYTLAAYSDFLLDQRRGADVLPLIPADTPSDPLLLRRVEASCAGADGECRSLSRRLDERFAASRARGDTVHRREEARFALAVENDPAKALALAKANWAVQKEVADLRILVDSARAAGDRTALRDAAEWVRRTGFEHAKIVPLLPGSLA